LRALGAGDARQVGGVVGVLGALVVLFEFLRIDGRPERHSLPAERAPAAEAASRSWG